MAKAKKKKNPEYKLIEKRSKRWAVLGKDGKYINGDEKVEKWPAAFSHGETWPPPARSSQDRATWRHRA